MLTDLKDKKILLIALPGYPDGIIKKMQELGAEVDYIHDKPNESFITKTLGRMQIKSFQKVIEDYYKETLLKLKDRNYDYILAIRGEYTPIESLKLMAKLFPHAKRVLYMWDGMHKQNTVGIEEKWPYYDKVFTFDRIDYLQNRKQLNFLPLYYYEDYLPTPTDDYKYDLSFIGTAHGDRVKVVKEVMRQCEDMGMKCFSYFFMPHPAVFVYNKLKDNDFKDVDIHDIHFKSLPFQKLYEIYGQSRCVIDVENKGQHGLTMRSLEILGLRKKFITTNKDIVNYDFYNQNNILVVDRNNPHIDQGFFDRNYEVLDESIYKKYTVGNWILNVLS